MVFHHPEDEDDGFEDEEEDEHEADESDSLLRDSFESEASGSLNALQTVQMMYKDDVPPKPEKSHLISIKFHNNCDEFIERTVTCPSELKPDVSELQQKSNKDALSYLKAKRINRHKNVDSSDSKKFKPSD